MFWLLLALGCACTSDHALPPDGREARGTLAQALLERDVDTITKAAQTASAWEGKDPSLDRLLGDALANVLMRPEAGLALLEANPAVGDPAWERATLNGTMRLGQAARLDALLARLGRTAIDFDHLVFGQVAVQAMSDAAITYELLEDVLADCRLLDGQPRVGRQALDLPADKHIIDAARVLGATNIVVGRPVRRTDPTPGTKGGPYHCISGLLLPARWPEAMPRSMTIGASDGETRLYLNIIMQADGPWAFAASDAMAGARWLQASIMLAALGETPDAAQQVQARFGHGLRGKR